MLGIRLTADSKTFRKKSCVDISPQRRFFLSNSLRRFEPIASLTACGLTGIVAQHPTTCIKFCLTKLSEAQYFKCGLTASRSVTGRAGEASWQLDRRAKKQTGEPREGLALSVACGKVGEAFLPFVFIWMEGRRMTVNLL